MGLPVTVKKGTVLSFNEPAREGTVKVGKKVFPFNSWDFRSERPLRFPRVGERVEAIFFPTTGKLLMLRSL